MEATDDLKEFGLAVLSLLTSSLQPQDHSLGAPIEELVSYASSLAPSSLFSSWRGNDGSTEGSRPAAQLVVDGSFDATSDSVCVDGGRAFVTASSAKSAAMAAASAVGRADAYWQSTVDAQSSWLQVELERPAYLLYMEIEFKWSLAVRSPVAFRN
jgi:hypothetical protein